MENPKLLKQGSINQPHGELSENPEPHIEKTKEANQGQTISFAPPSNSFSKGSKSKSKASKKQVEQPDPHD